MTVPSLGSSLVQPGRCWSSNSQSVVKSALRMQSCPSSSIHACLSVSFVLLVVRAPGSLAPVKKRSPLPALKSLMVGVIATKPTFLSSARTPPGVQTLPLAFDLPLQVHSSDSTLSFRSSDFPSPLPRASESACLRSMSHSDYRAEVGHSPLTDFNTL